MQSVSNSDYETFCIHYQRYDKIEQFNEMSLMTILDGTF